MLGKNVKSFKKPLRKIICILIIAGDSFYIIKVPQADLGSFDTLLFAYSIPGVAEAFFVETVITSAMMYSVKIFYTFTNLTTKFALSGNKSFLNVL